MKTPPFSQSHPCHSAYLAETTEETIMGPPLTTFVSHAVEALRNSHHTTPLNQSPHLLWNPPLTAHHGTLSCCNVLNHAILLALFTDGTAHNRVRLTRHLWTSHDNLQKTSQTNADLPWFTDGSYSRDENGKYAGHTIKTLFKRVPLRLAQKAKW